MEELGLVGPSEWWQPVAQFEKNLKAIPLNSKFNNNDKFQPRFYFPYRRSSYLPNLLTESGCASLSLKMENKGREWLSGLISGGEYSLKTHLLASGYYFGLLNLSFDFSKFSQRISDELWYMAEF